MKNDKPLKFRFRAGVAVFVIGWLMPIGIPFVVSSGLSMKWKTWLSALLAFGIPELFTFAAVAIFGKEGYVEIKAKIYRVFKKVSPPDAVGVVRYRIGLVFFSLPLLMGWFLPYVQRQFPLYETYRLELNIGGDLLLISSFFILGGDFWDKVRALFSHKKEG